MKPNWPGLDGITDPAALLAPLSELDSKLRQILDKGINSDNLGWPIVRWRLRDATEEAISNPISGKPRGFFPIAATNVADGTPLRITSWAFNSERTDGRLGITVAYTTGSATGDVTCILVGA